MNTRRWLVVVPLVLLAFLLQSAFWVPTYGSQSKGNPARLTTFIEAGIGDAKILNPTLAADRASSTVYEGRIFEGLVDADEHLELKPKLAERWETTEEAYIAAVPQRRLPNGQAASAAAILNALREALDAGRLAELKPSLRALELVAASERPLSESVMRPGKKGKPEPYSIEGKIHVPERVRLRLGKVIPGVFRQLEAVLGAGYFDNPPFERFFELARPAEMTELRPKLAELLPIGEHNPVVTFHVRRGVRFHDGHPLTARDVRFTYQALVDPKNASPRASSFENVSEVRLLDDYTVQVVYRQLYSPAIIDWAMGLLPEHLLNPAALRREMDRRRLSPEARAAFTLRSTDFNRNPVGTGPFRFVSWKPEESIHLTRNEHYWGDKPEYRDLHTRVIPDYVTQELELRAGAIDVYEPLPHQADRYRNDDDYHVVSSTEGVYAYIGYNLRRPLFQDVRVRRALGMAIDVNAIIQYVLSGEGKRTSGPFYSYTPYYDPAVKPLPYDPKGAAELLRQAGWQKNAQGLLEKDGKPFEFTLITNNANPQRRAIMTVAQEAWRKLGIRCVTQAFEWTVFLSDFIYKHAYDAMVLGWVGGDINPDKYQIWHSSQSDPMELNHVGYRSPRADALMERIRIEYDRDEQVRLARELHRLVAEDQPYTFLYEPTRPWVMDKKIMLVERGPGGRERYSKIAATASGQVDYYFHKWRKLASLPTHAE